MLPKKSTVVFAGLYGYIIGALILMLIGGIVYLVSVGSINTTTTERAVSMIMMGMSAILIIFQKREKFGFGSLLVLFILLSGPITIGVMFSCDGLLWNYSGSLARCADEYMWQTIFISVLVSFILGLLVGKFKQVEWRES